MIWGSGRHSGQHIGAHGRFEVFRRDIGMGMYNSAGPGKE